MSWINFQTTIIISWQVTGLKSLDVRLRVFCIDNKNWEHSLTTPAQTPFHCPQKLLMKLNRLLMNLRLYLAYPKESSTGIFFKVKIISSVIFNHHFWFKFTIFWDIFRIWRTCNTNKEIIWIIGLLIYTNKSLQM